MKKTTEELLVAACLAPEAELEQAVAEFDAKGSLDDLNEGTLRLASNLYRRLERSSLQSVHQNILKGVYTRYWYLYVIRNRPSLLSVIEVLNGREFLVLKGTALRVLIHNGDPAARPGSDIDILVRLADRESVLMDFLNKGFSCPNEQRVLADLDNRASVSLRKDNQEVDVHWALYPHAFQSSIQQDSFNASIPLVLDGQELKTLCLSQHLIHNLMHGFGRNEVSPVRWVIDCALMIQSPSMRWNDFASWAENWGWAKPILRQLVLLEEEYGISVPETVTRRLRRARSPWWMKMWLYHRTTSRNLATRMLSILLIQPLLYRANTNKRGVRAFIGSIRSWFAARFLLSMN